MEIQTRPIDDVTGHIVVHNIVDKSGKKVIKKGWTLTDEHIKTLRELGIAQLDVAVLEEDDVHEDDAAVRLAEALQTPAFETTRPVGGRVNFHTKERGVVYVDGERLNRLNSLPGITLGTVEPYSVVRPEKGESQVATLKIIPYAVPGEMLEHAVELAAARPGILELRPLPAQRVALLITAEPAAFNKVRKQFERVTRERVERLGSTLETVELVEMDETAVAEAASRLLDTHDMLIVAGQTSIMDEDDVTPRGLRHAGAEVALHGAPVEPGNLLALAYTPEKPIMCAPGCARSPSHNVIDMVLPRLLTGERLQREDIAKLGLGGLLK